MSLNINQAVDTYLSLKGVQGHFGGGSHDERVDNFGKEKHIALQAIQEHYGKPGQDASEIIKKIGKPDRMDTKIPELERQEAIESGQEYSDHGRIAGGQYAPVLPDLGPFMGEGSNSVGGQYYMIYQWRGNHDYVYFKIDSNTDKVTKSGWYSALD